MQTLRPSFHQNTNNPLCFTSFTWTSHFFAPGVKIPHGQSLFQGVSKRLWWKQYLSSEFPQNWCCHRSRPGFCWTRPCVGVFCTPTTSLQSGCVFSGLIKVRALSAILHKTHHPTSASIKGITSCELMMVWLYVAFVHLLLQPPSQSHSGILCVLWLFQGFYPKEGERFEAITLQYCLIF